jgi:hypothetical protein
MLKLPTQYTKSDVFFKLIIDLLPKTGIFTVYFLEKYFFDFRKKFIKLKVIKFIKHYLKQPSNFTNFMDFTNFTN